MTWQWDYKEEYEKMMNGEGWYNEERWKGFDLEKERIDIKKSDE